MTSRDAKATCFPRTCEFTIERAGASTNSTTPVPTNIVWIHDAGSSGTGDQLFFDQILVPRHKWTFSSYRRSICWYGPWGGGILYFSSNGRLANGMVGKSCCQVVANATAEFLCDVAPNTGAVPIESGQTITGFSWDCNSSQWASAAWQTSRLKLSYQSDSANVAVTFQDLLATGSSANPTWASQPGASLSYSSSSAEWLLHFTSQSSPALSWPKAPASELQSILPYYMEAKESTLASSISGAMEVISDPNGTIIGFTGSAITGALCGYYRTSADAAPFGVFDDSLTVDAKPVARAVVLNDRIEWSGLSESLQSRLGLKAAGTFHFSSGGIPPAGIQRLNETQLAAALVQHSDLYPSFHTTFSTGDSTAASALTIQGLIDMDPYLINPKSNNVYNAVTASVSSDLFTIMNSQVPSSLWSNLFPADPQPTLSSELSIIANTPLTGYPDPLTWYQSLSTALITVALANSSQSPCELLNGNRASAWLKGEVANSPVYQKHSQLLMAYHWEQMFPSISNYLNDQKTNTTYYSTTSSSNPNSIQYLLQQDLTAIQNLGASSSTVTQMVSYATSAANYATENKLYWAFALYKGVTSQAFLANVNTQLQSGADSSAVFTLIQQLISTLTVLDPSGQMAAYYNQALNAFLGSSVIASQMDLTQGVVPDSVVTGFLYEWVQSNLNSDIASIKQAAQELNQLLTSSTYQNTISGWLTVMRESAAGISQFSRVVQRLVNYLQGHGYNYSSKVANVIGTGLSLSLTGLNLYCLIEGFSDWKNLTPAQQSGVVIGATTMVSRGLNILVTTGGEAWKAFELTSGSSFGAWDRMQFVWKYININPSAADAVDQLGEMLSKSAAAGARWYTEMSGVTSSLIDSESASMAVTVTAEDVSVFARVLGANLSEFLVNRLGPALAIAGVAMSIYFLAQRPKGLVLVSDVLGLISGALAAFATIGTMFAVEGTALATACAVAGPLAIVAAVAGIAVIFIEMFQTPPNPYADFVNNQAAGAGFTVTSHDGAIDYAVVFSPNSGPQRIGFTLAVNGGSAQFLSAGTGGAISIVDSVTSLPDCVWQVTTDGLGMSQIFTVLKPTASSSPATYYLTLTAQNGIVFQAALPSSPAPSVGNPPTQKWFSTVTGNVTTVDGKNDGVFLNTLDMTLQPLLTSSSGDQPKGYMMVSDGGITYSSSPSTPTQFTLQTAGMAPNFLQMKNLSFAKNVLVNGSFGCIYGAPESASSTTYSITPALPSFLSFSSDTGHITGNSNTSPSSFGPSTFTITQKNSLGSDSVSFTIQVPRPSNG